MRPSKKEQDTRHVPLSRAIQPMIYEQSYRVHTFLSKLSPFIQNIHDTARLPPSDYRAAEARQEYLANTPPPAIERKNDGGDEEEEGRGARGMERYRRLILRAAPVRG